MSAPASSVDEVWSIDGIPLHQMGFAVQTKSGRFRVPPLRGDNSKAAYVPGELWLPKIPDAYTLNLPMFLIGADAETGAPVDHPVAAFNDNFAYLCELLWQPNREFVIGRRRWRTNPTTGDPELVYAEALGQYAGGLDAAMTGPTRATFTLDIRLAHPFFYGPVITVPPLARGATAVVTNPGQWDAWARNIWVDFIGPLTAPRLTNTFSGGTSIYCGLTGQVPAGKTLTLDVGAFLALQPAAGGYTNRTGEIYNAGTRAWMALLKGPNNISFSATAGTGSAVIRYRPPYL